MTAVIEDPYRFGTIITSFDLHLHSEGKLYESWNTMGAHCMTVDGVDGVRFAVWAPNAETVSVAGDFPTPGIPAAIPCACAMPASGKIFLPHAKAGDSSKVPDPFPRLQGYQQLKADPFADSRQREASEVRFRRLRSRPAPVERCCLDGSARTPQLAQGAHLGVRGAPGIVEAWTRGQSR